MIVAEFDRKGDAALNDPDARLSGNPFPVGGGATIADISCYSDVAFAWLSNKDLATWLNVIAWAERTGAFP